MSLALALLFLAPPRPTEFVFVRHGETVANATGKYNSRTLNVFSDRGRQQVVALTAKLSGMKFDLILVSPSERALRTVAPYLRASRQKATIWPELYECCHQVGAARNKPATPNVVYGPKITVSPDLGGLFLLRPGGERLISAPTYNDGMRQIRMGRDKLIEAFRGSGERILIVSHSLEAGRLMELLQGKPALGKMRPGNTEIIRLQEGAGGKFQIVK